MSKPIYFGRKIIQSFGNYEGLIAVLNQQKLEYKIVNDNGVFFVILSGIKYVVEDTPEEWRLCPVMREWKQNTQCNFTNFLPIPKPKPD